MKLVDLHLISMNMMGILLVGDVKRAEDQFRIVFDRTTKGQNSGSKKKRYLFGALVGMVSQRFAVLYILENSQQYMFPTWWCRA